MTRWIIGNWKMHKTRDQAVQFIAQLASAPEVKVALAVSYTLISPLRERGELVCQIGGQNISEYAEGAYTGEVSGAMLKDVGAEFTLVGHSERRHIFHETNEQVCAKFERCIVENIPVILCVGETQQDLEEGGAASRIEEQLTVFTSLIEHQLELVKIAYEPVWAIGTGVSAKSQEIAERHEHIRQYLAEAFSPEAAAKVPILYGGSVGSENVEEICQLANVDGVLVGTTSLDIEKFNALIAKVTV